MRTPAWLSILLLAGACGGGGSAGIDATDTVDGGGSNVLGPLMPQDVAGDKTAVMATPTVLPITYDGDADRADIEAFFPQYAASPAWAQQTAEYGVGPLTIATPVHLAGSAATSDAMVQALLTANLTGTSPAWGAPSENTIYSFTLPESTSFNDGTDSFCCQDYDGYHDDTIIGGVDIAYAIQCVCPAGFAMAGITPLQELTTTMAHETVEASTDPRPENDYAFGDVDQPHEVWSYITDGEIADLCEYADTAYWSDAPGMTYTIQRIWSNAAARAGTDPCIGDPTVPYYQTVPEMPDDVTIAPYGGDLVTKGTTIALGATGTITLTVAGTPGSGPFIVVADDAATLYEGANLASLSFIQPSGLFKIGDTVTIQTKVERKDAGLGGSGAEAYQIETMPMNGGPTTYYYGIVGQ